MASKWEFAQLSDEKLIQVLGPKEEDTPNPSSKKNKAGALTFACFVVCWKTGAPWHDLLLQEHWKDGRDGWQCWRQEVAKQPLQKGGIEDSRIQQIRPGLSGSAEALQRWPANWAIEAAQRVRTSYEQLKDARVRKGGELGYSVEYLYGCRCGIMPLKSSHWFLIRKPRRERILDLHSVWREICPIAVTSIFRREASGSGSPCCSSALMGVCLQTWRMKLGCSRWHTLCQGLQTPDPNAVTTGEILKAIESISAGSVSANELILAGHPCEGKRRSIWQLATRHIDMWRWQAFLPGGGLARHCQAWHTSYQRDCLPGSIDHGPRDFGAEESGAQPTQAALSPTICWRKFENQDFEACDDRWVQGFWLPLGVSPGRPGPMKIWLNKSLLTRSHPRHRSERRLWLEARGSGYDHTLCFCRFWVWVACGSGFQLSIGSHSRQTMWNLGCLSHHESIIFQGNGFNQSVSSVVFARVGISIYFNSVIKSQSFIDKNWNYSLKVETMTPGLLGCTQPLGVDSW